MGRKKLPFYRIIAVDSRVRRDGKPLEFLGWYDPLKKEANLNAPAIKKWLEGELGLGRGGGGGGGAGRLGVLAGGAAMLRVPLTAARRGACDNWSPGGWWQAEGRAACGTRRLCAAAWAGSTTGARVFRRELLHVELLHAAGGLAAVVAPQHTQAAAHCARRAATSMALPTACALSKPPPPSCPCHSRCPAQRHCGRAAQEGDGDGAVRRAPARHMPRSST